jgi:murein DD-endopeptidase MepM/ murein hydrolase activator NlpD
LNRKNEPIKGVSKGIFRDTGISPEAGIDAAEAAKLHPEALTQTEAVEMYIGNSAADARCIFQEALLAYVTQEPARLRDQITDIRKVVDSKANSKSKTKKIEKLLLGIDTVSLLEAEYLSGLRNYIRNKPSKSEESRQAKESIDTLISSALTQSQIQTTAETPELQLAEALRDQATKGKTRFEMLIDTYSSLPGQFISEEVMQVGKGLTTKDEWLERLEKAEESLTHIQKETLNEHEKLYLKQAIGHIERYNQMIKTEFLRNYGSVIIGDIREILSEKKPAEETEATTHPANADKQQQTITYTAVKAEPASPRQEEITKEEQYIPVANAPPGKQDTELNPTKTTAGHTAPEGGNIVYENTPLPILSYPFILQRKAKQETAQPILDRTTGTEPKNTSHIPLQETAAQYQKDIFAAATLEITPQKRMVFADAFDSGAFERPTEDYLKPTFPKPQPTTLASEDPAQKEEYAPRIVSKINQHLPERESMREQSDLFFVTQEMSAKRHKRKKQKIAVGAAASGTVLTAALIAIAASSAVPKHDAFASYSSKTTPVLITNPVPEKTEEPKTSLPQTQQKESDQDYCYRRLMGEYEGSKMPLRKVKKSELSELVRRCWLPQARRMNPEFLKNADLGEYGQTQIMVSPDMADYIYVKTSPRTSKGSDGKDQYVIDTYFDPMGTSMIMSKWRSLRRGWIVNSENGAMVCAQGQFKIPVKNKKTGKPRDDSNDYQNKAGENAKPGIVVDGTDIKPATGIDKIAASGSSETKTEDIADDSSYSGTPAADPEEKADNASSEQTNSPSSQPSTAAKTASKTSKSKQPKKKPNFACGRNHGGVDLTPAASKNRNLGVYEHEETAPIYASREGYVVRLVKNSHLAGNYVVIWHGKDQNGNDIYSEYMHMKRFSTKLETAFRQKLLETLVKHNKGKPDQTITSKYDEHLRKKTGTAVFEKGKGPFVVPYVLEELVHMQCQKDESLSEDEKNICNREGASIGPMGGSGNATKEYAHLHYQHRIGERLFNPELFIPVVDKGPGVDFDEEHAKQLVAYASLAGLDPNIVLGVRENEAKSMEDKSRAGAAGFMQIMPVAVSMASAQCYLEKSRLESKRKEAEENKKSASAKGLPINEAEEKIREISEGIATYSGFCETLSSKDAWRSVSEDPSVNMFAGVMILKRNYDRFGGDYEKAVSGYNRGPGAIDEAIRREQQELTSIESKIHKAETSGDVKGLIRLREQKEKINWKNFIGSTRAYMNRVINYATADESESQEAETEKEAASEQNKTPAARNTLNEQTKQSYHMKILESNPYQRMQIRKAA